MSAPLAPPNPDLPTYLPREEYRWVVVSRMPSIGYRGLSRRFASRREAGRAGECYWGTDGPVEWDVQEVPR